MFCIFGGKMSTFLNQKGQSEKRLYRGWGWFDFLGEKRNYAKVLSKHFLMEPLFKNNDSAQHCCIWPPNMSQTAPSQKQVEVES
jgi:hypothetical protein